jgi:phosphoglycolate phosphatase-like HAD superfamily hydrolase
VKAVGFDADGVLVDSRAFAWRFAERVLATFGIAASIASSETMETAFGPAAQSALVGQQHAGVLRMTHRLAMRHSAAEIGLFHDAISVVERVPVSRLLITAALGDGIATCLGDHSQLFDEIVGFESGRKPELLAQFAPRLSVYVTDTSIDINDCKALGIPVVGVCWGYDTRNSLEAAGPDAIAETPEQLLEFINHFVKEQSQ